MRRRWLRLRTLHGRALAAAALALAVALLVVRPGGGPAGPGGGGTGSPGTAAVAVAVTDLPAGHLITESDVTIALWAPRTVPDGVLADAPGRVLAAPVRRGEPFTDVRVLGAGLLRGQPPGTRAVTVRVADAAAAALARPGDRVDVLAAADLATGGLPLSGNASAEVVLDGALVLAAPAGAPGDASGAASDAAAGTDATGLGSLTGDGPSGASGVGASGEGLLVLAVDAAQARRLAAAAGSRPLSVALRATG